MCFASGTLQAIFLCLERRHLVLSTNGNCGKVNLRRSIATSIKNPFRTLHFLILEGKRRVSLVSTNLQRIGFLFSLCAMSGT